MRDLKSSRVAVVVTAVIFLGVTPACAASSTPTQSRQPVGPAEAGSAEQVTAIVNASAPVDDLLGSTRCGGALIAPRIVLTASHCLSGANPAKLDVIIGADNLCRTAAVSGERIGVAAIKPAAPASLDAAALILDRPARTPPLTLSTAPASATDRYFAVGWGSTGRSPQSCHRQTVELTQGPAEACETGRQAAPQWDSATLFCGVPVAGADRNTCSGDSGAPLLHVDDGRTTLFAIVSWGVGCEVDDVGFYTRVHNLRAWLSTLTP